MSDAVVQINGWKVPAFILHFLVLGTLGWFIKEAAALHAASREHATTLLSVARMLSSAETQVGKVQAELGAVRLDLARVIAINETLRPKAPSLTYWPAPEETPEPEPAASAPLEPAATWDDRKAKDYLEQRIFEQHVAP